MVPLDSAVELAVLATRGIAAVDVPMLVAIVAVQVAMTLAMLLAMLLPCLAVVPAMLGARRIGTMDVAMFTIEVAVHSPMALAPVIVGLSGRIVRGMGRFAMLTLFPALLVALFDPLVALRRPLLAAPALALRDRRCVLGRLDTLLANFLPRLLTYFLARLLALLVALLIALLDAFVTLRRPVVAGVPRFLVLRERGRGGAGRQQ